MKPVLINEEAADELDEAIRYYETKSRAIGFSLADKVSEAFNRIQRNPQLYPFHRTRTSKDALSEGSLHRVLHRAWLSWLHTKGAGRIIGNSD